MGRITVELDPSDQGIGQRIIVTTDVSDLLYQSMQPLDKFDWKAPPLYQMICTDQQTVQRVTKLRKDAAKILSEALTEMLMEAFERNDTIMGYDRDQYEQFQSL